MSTAVEFITQLEAILIKSVGRIVGLSILKNQLAKLNKAGQALSPAEYKVLTQNVVAAVALFATKEEAGRIQLQLNSLLKACFPVS